MIDTQRCCFLFHHTPPPDFGGNPLLLLSDTEGKVHVGTLEEVSRVELPIVTHSFSLLVDWFRGRTLPLPKQVVDLEVAQKLLVGRPKSDFDVERPWDMPSMLRRFVHQRYDPARVRATLAMHLAKPPISDFANLRWMTAIAGVLPALWREMLVELETKGELLRFLDVEVPTYNSMLASQCRGIRLAPGRRDILLQELERDYVSAHHQLAIGKGIDVERALADPQYLSGYLLHPIQNHEEFSDVHQVVDARKELDPVCALLDAVADARRNRSILLRSFGNDADHCYPVFDTMGTVTGRILAVDPHLQHLGRKYRSIIQARADHKLVYVDYSQFEPNIMASISKDAQFLALCNAGDIYKRMAIALCGDAKHRKTVKLMFLAYSYGKTLASLPDFLVEIHGTREKAEAVINERFVPLFTGIEKWKLTIESQLTASGKIGTLLGNFRNRAVRGDLDAKERRWAVSQVVQGTGSLILKKLINSLTAKHPEVVILLPMHDALLVEVPEQCATEVTAALLVSCRSAFTELCPLVAPSVSVKDFFA
jgi:DNA polymerase-1